MITPLVIPQSVNHLTSTRKIELLSCMTPRKCGSDDQKKAYLVNVSNDCWVSLNSIKTVAAESVGVQRLCRHTS